MDNVLERAPRFLIAKYAPDLRRMEPRNIGIVFWCDGVVLCRFIGQQDETNEVEYTPKFVRAKNKPVYRDWVGYWELQAARDSLPGPDGTPIKRTAPEFLDALRRTSRENFILVDGGFLFDPIAGSDDVRDVLDHLFESLVADKDMEPELREFELLHRGWQRFAKRAGLKDTVPVRESKSIRGTVGGVSRAFDFTTVIGNGEPEGALQKVIAGSQQSVNSASFMFEVVAKARNWRPNRFGAVVHATRGQLKEQDISSAVAQLAEFSTIINVADVRDAVSAFKGMEIPLHGHG